MNTRDAIPPHIAEKVQRILSALNERFQKLARSRAATAGAASTAPTTAGDATAPKATE